MAFSLLPLCWDEVACREVTEIHGLPGTDSCEHLLGGGSRHLSLEDVLDELGQRLAARFRPANELAVKAIPNVTNLNHL